ncbi:hypothetical protein GJ496_007082, partial [Pomphorhynchus laevis]
SSHRIMLSKDQEGQVEALRIKQETEEINALRKNADIQPGLSIEISQDRYIEIHVHDVEDVMMGS